MATTRTTFKVCEPLWQHFTQQTEALFLKRDAFLNHMIRLEIPRLEQELEGRKELSEKARRYLAGELKRLDGQPKTVVIEQETADDLDKVVKRMNLFRDGFINRLIVWLRSSDVLLQKLQIPTTLDELGESNGGEPNGMPVSPLGAIEAVRNDPFTYIREYLKPAGSGGVYTVHFPEELIGLSCYLDDEQIPDTEAYNLKKMLGETL